MFLRVFLILVLIAVLFGTYVRVAPTNPDNWHIDPELADNPGALGYQMKAAESPVWAETPEELMTVLGEVALAAPRTIPLAGTPEERHFTFETRSQIWGFPDYTTIRAIEGDDGTRLSIHATARYGAADLGVNKGRVENWLQRLSAVLPPQ